LDALYFDLAFLVTNLDVPSYQESRQADLQANETWKDYCMKVQFLVNQQLKEKDPEKSEFQVVVCNRITFFKLSLFFFFFE
jgi:hypothetical protein